MEDEIAWKISSLEEGNYIFWFTETREERRALLIPFFRRGLSHGDKLLVLGTKAFFQSSLAEEIKGSLGEEGMRSRGQLNAYLLSDTELGRREIKSPDDLVEFMRIETERAHNEGYPSVRIMVEMDVLLQKCQDIHRFFEYEAQLDRFFPESRCVGLFVLDPMLLDPGIVSVILSTQARIGICDELYTNPKRHDSGLFRHPGDFSRSLLRRYESSFVGARGDKTQPANAAWLRAAFDGMSQFVAVLQPDGELTEINPAGLELMGARRHQLVGLRFWEGPWCANLPDLQENIKQAIGKAAWGEFTRLPASPSINKPGALSLDMAFQPVLDAGGEVAYLVCTGRDTSETRSLGRRLNERDQLIQSVVNAAPLLLFLVDKSGVIRFSSAGPDSAIAKIRKRFSDHLAPDAFPDIPEIQRYLERALQGETFTTRLELEGRTFETRFTPACGESGQAQGVVVVVMDITRQVWAEDTLYRSETRVNAMLAESPLAILLLDLEGRIISCNPAFQTMLGFAEEELIRKPIFEWVSPDDVRQDQAFLHSVACLEKDYYEIEKRYVRKNGDLVWSHDVVWFIPGAAGESPFMLAICEDITQRKEMENALRVSEERFRTSVDTMLDAFMLLSPIRDDASQIVNFSYEYVNDSACQLNLTTREELIGRRLLDFLPQHKEKGLVDEYARVVETGQPLVKESMDYEDTWDGRKMKRTFDIRAARLDDRLAVSWREVTERKRVESELGEVQRQLLVNAEAERLKLAQDLHDGPIQDLYGVTFQVHELQEALRHTNLEPTSLTIQETLQQVIAVLRGMCSEMRPPTLAPFGLEKAIRSHAENFHRRHPGLSIHLDLTPDGQLLPEQVRMGFFRIYQELLNNVARHSKASEVSVNFRLSETEAMLDVEDNGCGFEVPHRWVEIVRQGHLGLVGLQERAEALGGSVSIDSAIGKGTRVGVIIPRPEKSVSNTDQGV